MKSISLFILAFSILSCSKTTAPEPQTSLIGKWKYVGISSGTGNGPEQVFTKADKIIVYQFNENLTYSINDIVQTTKYSIEKNDSPYSVITLGNALNSYIIKKDTLGLNPVFKVDVGKYRFRCDEGCASIYVKVK
jgi:hypothetical protein